MFQTDYAEPPMPEEEATAEALWRGLDTAKAAKKKDGDAQAEKTSTENGEETAAGPLGKGVEGTKKGGAAGRMGRMKKGGVEAMAIRRMLLAARGMT